MLDATTPNNGNFRPTLSGPAPTKGPFAAHRISTVTMTVELPSQGNFIFTTSIVLAIGDIPSFLPRQRGKIPVQIPTGS